MRGKLKAAGGCVVAVLAIAYAIAFFAPAVGTFHDDGVYLVTAKALAEGRGYRIISLPQETPQTKYPPLFPLALAAVWKLNPDFPANLPWLKLVPLLAGVGWLWVSFLLLRQEGVDQAPAASIVFLAAASPWVVYLSTALLAETLFALLATGSLLLARRVERGLGRRWTWLAAAILAVGACHARTIGVALLLAIPASLWLKGRRREAAGFAACAALLCLPWLLWTAAQQHAATDPYYTKANYRGWNIILNFTWHQKAIIFFENAAAVLISPVKLAGLPATGFLAPIVAIAGAIVTFGLRKIGWNAISAFLMAYTGILCCWAWHPGRLLIPLLPLLWWGGWLAIEPLAPKTRAALACAMVAMLTVNLGATSLRTHQLGDALPGLDPRDSWHAQAQLLQWVKSNTPKDTVLAGNLDPLYYLITGRKAVRGFSTSPYELMYGKTSDAIGAREKILQSLKDQGARYWLQTPNSAFAEGPVLGKMQTELADPGRQFMKQAAGAGGFFLYEIKTDVKSPMVPDRGGN
jgi:hypothetical protein